MPTAARCGSLCGLGMGDEGWSVFSAARSMVSYSKDTTAAAMAVYPCASVTIFLQAAPLFSF